MASMDFCDGDYLGSYRRFLEHHVANVARDDDQLPVKMGCRDVRECEINGAIADIALQHLNQRICPSSLQAYLVKKVIQEFKIHYQNCPEECGYQPQDKVFSPLKLMQSVTYKVNEMCLRYLDNSRLALLPPPPSIPLPLVSSHAIRNKRRKMEDRSVVLHDLHTMFSINNESVVNYYAVFDGHGGQETAVYCAAHLHQYLLESPHYPIDIEKALLDAFNTVDHRFTELDKTNNSGATAVCALLYDKTLYIAWVGDSQAALIKNGRGINLTIPHKPERPDEKERIESLGGEIIFFGSWRVNGVLNVSRSIGDFKYKPYISHVPDIKKIHLNGNEDFLVIACDGFWEKATEEIVASLMYEYVTNNQNHYSSASEALVSWAKQNLSEDNISVIVVFLTPPNEVAAKNFYQIQRASVPGSMEQPGYQSQDRQPPYDLGFAKTPTNNGVVVGDVLDPVNFLRQTPPKFHYDDDEEDEKNGAVAATNGSHHEPASAPMNGKHNNSSSRFEYDDDDDERDFGPETNVDAVDEAPEDFGKLDQAMAPHVYPDEFLLNKSMSQREAECFEAAAAVEDDIRPRHEVLHEGDNVADSEESEDEWNFYRPEDKTASKDPALVEKSDPSEGEKELCSPKPSEDDDNNLQGTIGDQLVQQEPQQEEHLPPTSSFTAESAQTAAASTADLEPDEITAEFDELHQNNEGNLNLEQPHIELKEADAEADSTVILEEELPLDKEEPELVNLQKNNEENEEEDEDMDSHLNPDAAEFVPVSPTSAIPHDLDVFTSDLISGSPLKQSQRALKNRAIPSEEEFKEEISSRPSDIDDTTMSDFSNGDLTPHKSSPFTRGGFEDSKQVTALMFDESEVSSTKAEFGDDTVANFSVTSELQKTGISNEEDCSFTGSEKGGNFMANCMATSMTPNELMQAFNAEPDLNQVHELKDEDLLADLQNGGYTPGVKDNAEEEKKDLVDEDDDLGKDNIEVDMENLSFHQDQHIEAFSAVVEEKVTDNEDLFMNIRNSENSHDYENNEQAEDLSIDKSSHPTNNPFANDYSPAPEADILGLTDGLQNMQIESEAKAEHQLPDLLANDMPVVQEKQPDQVMQNPLDLNFGNPPEQKDSEMFLVSPVKDPEVMTSKYAEEENISDNLAKEEESFGALNRAEAPSFVPTQQVNLSESLQEFTGLEEELLTPKVNDNAQEPRVLKENLVDELKDVEEVSPAAVSDEAKVEQIPFTNEANEILSNEIVETKKDSKADEALAIVGTAVAATAIAATAVAAASESKVTKSATIASSKTTAKPTSSKPGAKTSASSPTKPATTAAKKPATATAAPRTKLGTATTKAPTSTLSKTAPGTKTNLASKPASSAAPKPASRPTTASTTALKSKPLSGVASKISSSSADKKPTTNGTSAVKSTTAAKPALKSATASATSKTGLVTKTSSTTRTSGVGLSSAPKPRPTSAATATKTTAKPNATSSLTNSTARPKTAPASTLAAKSKVGTTATKSPMIDKQIKETANKQISSARVPATTASKARQSLAPPTSAAVKKSPVTTKTRTSLAPPPKAQGANKVDSAASPIKKPPPIKNPNAKSAVSKVNSKVTSVKSTTVTSNNVEAKPVQNGVCESNETVVTSNITTTTVTTNIEEDLPKKDVSPIEQPTDNQLISAE